MDGKDTFPPTEISVEDSEIDGKCVRIKKNTVEKIDMSSSKLGDSIHTTNGLWPINILHTSYLLRNSSKKL
jgi:hypothetical protein